MSPSTSPAPPVSTTFPVSPLETALQVPSSRTASAASPATLSLLDASYARRFLDILFKCGAIKLSFSKPFLWASGRKAPMYCDNRQLLAHPTFRKEIKEVLVKGVRQEIFPSGTNPSRKGIAAVATAGIPFGALLADALDLPLAYVRATAKAHGLKRQIEGNLPPGGEVLLFEDLVSTGGSVLKAAQILQDLGYKVLAVVALLSYNLPEQQQAFSKHKIPLYVLADDKALLAAVREQPGIGEADAKALGAFLSS